MKRILMVTAGALACAVGTAAIASAQGAVSAHTSSTAKVELRHTSLGSILTTSSGLTLYMFTHDHGSENSCVKIHECAKSWPALDSSGTPLAGPGVQRSLLSTIRVAGAKQVTYAGHALYTFSEDMPGSTGYVGVKEFGGNWYALSAAGHEVK
jgi:predicted lipoprotein with Yx(FWY)xxD motif